MEKKLYALVTDKNKKYGSYGGLVIQVSFNKKELEEIAECLNKIEYFCPHATVEEVNECTCEWYWPCSHPNIK